MLQCSPWQGKGQRISICISITGYKEEHEEEHEFALKKPSDLNPLFLSPSPPGPLEGYFQQDLPKVLQYNFDVNNTSLVTSIIPCEIIKGLFWVRTVHFWADNNSIYNCIFCHCSWRVQIIALVALLTYFLETINNNKNNQRTLMWHKEWTEIRTERRAKAVRT